MLEERFRLMYLSKEGTGIKQINLSWRKLFLVVFLLFVILVSITAFSIGLFTRLYHNYRIVSLENDRKHLKRELLAIKEKVASLNNRLAYIEATDDELRNVASLPPIDNDTRQVGVGGPSLYKSLDVGYYADGVSKTALEINMDLSKLERAVRLERSSMEEIAAKLKARRERIDHFPSIRPILGGHITDGFGYRIDPFTKKLTHHDGVDIPMPMGTPVLATADGVVTLVKTIYKPHKSYGMEVVIDHGYGFVTRYAHLSKILVHKGQKVKRWQPIGEVGETGKATGPHLHYEVLYQGKPQDPENFIYN